MKEKQSYLDFLAEQVRVSQRTARVGRSTKATKGTMQPAPLKNNPNPDVWDIVIADMKQRNRTGAAKYGITLKPFNGRDVLQDAYEEALDLCVYLRQAIYERDNVNAAK